MARPLTARHFRWLPNALTISRILLAFVVVWAAANGRWALGFWVFALALGTDFLDGLAAKKLHAQTEFGRQLDRRADALISGGGLIGLAVAGELSWWAFVVISAVPGVISEERFYPFKTGVLHRLRPAISVTYLFGVWIFIGLTYLTEAYGWHWWYAALVLSVVVVAASLKRHRLRAWLGRTE